MDAGQFDAVVRALQSASSRRSVLAGIAALAPPGVASAKTRRKPRPVRNAFGCVDVGGFCFGRDAFCCSGRCTGNKPKQGKKDKRRCAAHDASTCQIGDDACGPVIVPCVTTKGSNLGGCFTTTGNAPYCTAAVVSCRSFTKDADCVAKCGAGAACLKCEQGACFAQTGRYCVGLDRACDP